jgi:hypothetical protein
MNADPTPIAADKSNDRIRVAANSLAKFSRFHLRQSACIHRRSSALPEI